MRPVNKGYAPYSSISDYGEALPFLERAIGLYCSYCEFPLIHVPEVEHIVSKKHGGELTDWNNLLVSCKYCNTRKKAIINKANVDEYLWPDQYNTALAYNYENGVPTVNEDNLINIDPSGDALKKAQNLFDLIKLDNIPLLREKDRRARERNRAFECALDSLVDYQKGKEMYPEQIEALSKQIIRTAIYSGFFSIWTTIFAEEPEILRALINAFPGTEKSFFDENGLPKPILKQTKELCCV
jgi:hypothetical protein